MRKPFLNPLLLVVSLVLAGNACDRGPTRPSPVTGTPLLTRLELLGPVAIAPGDRAQFKLIAHWSDGTNRDVVHEAIWNSSTPSVATIDAAGAAVGHRLGDTVITGAFGLRTSTVELIVVPTGTYRVKGRVVESVGQRAPVAGAFVEEARSRISTVTDANGDFALYGVRTDTGLQVSKDGYFEVFQPLPRAQHAMVTVSLIPRHAVPDISGTYQLTITAGSCADVPPLSAALKQRRFTAVVRQSGQQLDVVLGGDAFGRRGPSLANRFWGVAGVTGATFSLEAGDFYYYRTTPFVIERLEDDSFLAIVGQARVTPSGNGLTGEFGGSLTHSAADGKIAGTCTSATHSFVMTR